MDRVKSYGGRGLGGGGVLFLSVREAYLPNFRTLLSLEPLKKVPGWWVGGGLGCVKFPKSFRNFTASDFSAIV